MIPMKAKKRLLGCYKRHSERLFIAFKDSLILRLDDIANTVPNKGKICELGSGLGMVSIFLAITGPGREVAGYDFSARKLRTAKEASRHIENVRFARKDLRKGIPQGFDAYLLVDFLHHLGYPEQVEVLKSISKHQKKGGLLIIKEIKKGKSFGFALNYFCDKAMTGLDCQYFRRKEEWIRLVSGMGYLVEEKEAGGIFPHVLLSCIKR